MATGKSKVVSGYLKTKDGIEIKYHQISPSKPKSYLALVNGRSEWTTKYEDLHDRLQLAPSCSLFTWDHRGQGESEGLAYHIDSYQQFIDDAATVVSHCVPDSESYGIVGHSMGGLIGLLGVMTGRLQPDFLILSAPLLQLPNRPLKRGVAERVAKSVSRMGFAGFPTGASRNKENFFGNDLTHSIKRFQELFDSPKAFQSPTFGWVSATFSSTQRVFHESLLQKLNTPTLVLGGTKEEVVDYRGFSEWVLKASELSDAPVEYRSIPGGRHELLNETPRILQQVRMRIWDWLIREQIPSPQFEINGVGN